METITLGSLADGPHADLIHAMTSKCAADDAIQAIWVGGSLATGTGDQHSDVDFRIAVAPGQVAAWTTPDWAQYLPIASSGGVMMRFGEQALLHHLVLEDGTILDFYVQDTERENYEPNLVILACRDAAFQTKLEGFARPTASLAREINGEETRRFFVDYWITTHKELKALARQYDLSPFVGLYYERVALLRAWYMQATGKDITARPTIHMLGALHRGLASKFTAEQQAIVGMPSRTPEETMAAVEAIRAEMAALGRLLAEQYGFDYPHALEAVVEKAWREHKAAIVKR